MELSYIEMIIAYAGIAFMLDNDKIPEEGQPPVIDFLERLEMEIEKHQDDVDRAYEEAEEEDFDPFGEQIVEKNKSGCIIIEHDFRKGK